MPSNYETVREDAGLSQDDVHDRRESVGYSALTDRSRGVAVARSNPHGGSQTSSFGRQRLSLNFRKGWLADEGITLQRGNAADFAPDSKVR
jgi:hypothetical protein